MYISRGLLVSFMTNEIGIPHSYSMNQKINNVFSGSPCIPFMFIVQKYVKVHTILKCVLDL